MQKEKCFKGCLKENKIRRHAETLRAANSASSTLAVLQENSNNTRGRSRIKYGMTTNFDNNGFTLIELLVVVLIIGILAAVALPQYQKAVEKARASEALPLLKSVYQASQAYKMANGDWPEKFDELAVEIPWTGNVKWRNMYVMRDTRSNNLWSLQIYKETGFTSNVTLGRISGKYEGVGFQLYENGNWSCVEKTGEGKVFSGNPGDYCVKIMRCPNTPSVYPNGRYYAYKP